MIIIDEWDAIFREYKDDKEGQKKYLDFLRDWMKDKEYIALAYMTGILPIKKYGKHSALNMFREFSMTQPQQLAPYMGFTAEEVQSECKRRKLRFDAYPRSAAYLQDLRNTMIDRILAAHTRQSSGE